MLKIFKNFFCLQGQAWVPSKSEQISVHDMTLSYKLMHYHHPHIYQHMYGQLDIASRHSRVLSWHDIIRNIGIVWTSNLSKLVPYSIQDLGIWDPFLPRCPDKIHFCHPWDIALKISTQLQIMPLLPRFWIASWSAWCLLPPYMASCNVALCIILNITGCLLSSIVPAGKC